MRAKPRAARSFSTQRQRSPTRTTWYVALNSLSSVVTRTSTALEGVRRTEPVDTQRLVLHVQDEHRLERPGDVDPPAALLVLGSRHEALVAWMKVVPHVAVGAHVLLLDDLLDRGARLVVLLVFAQRAAGYDKDEEEHGEGAGEEHSAGGRYRYG